MPKPFPQPPKIVVLTGPGLSREAGFTPFDPATMPPGTTLEDVVTQEGFARDPAKVQDFYNLRRRELIARAMPGSAYDALSVLWRICGDGVLVVTRNLDDFHERTGIETVLHTHGELLKARCTICTHLSDRLDDVTPDSECPICGNAGYLRPHILWAGEEPQHIPQIFEALAHCRTFAAIGAGGGGLVESFLAEAKRAGAHTMEFAAEPTPASALFDKYRHGSLFEHVSGWVENVVDKY